LLQERIEKANPRRALTADETKHVNKLKARTDNFKRVENNQSSGLVTN